MQQRVVIAELECRRRNSLLIADRWLQQRLEQQMRAAELKKNQQQVKSARRKVVASGKAVQCYVKPSPCRAKLCKAISMQALTPGQRSICLVLPIAASAWLAGT